MCELFGFSGNKKTDLVKELREFYSHAPENPHGWGLYLDEGKSIFCNKEAKRADQSDTLRRILSKKVIAKDAIAHA